MTSKVVLVARGSAQMDPSGDEQTAEDVKSDHAERSGIKQTHDDE